MNLLKFRNTIEISVGDTAQLIAEAVNEIVITDEAHLGPENSEVGRLWADNANTKQFFGWSAGYGDREGNCAAWLKPLNANIYIL